MFKFELKYLYLGLVIVLVLFGFVFYQNKNNLLEICVLDVGQGDSILIKTPDHQKILIDGGPDNKVLAKLGEQMLFYEKKIDLIILTHPHSDHVVGLNEILNRYQVDEIWITGVIHTSPDYLVFLNEIKNKNIKFINHAFKIGLGDQLELRVLYPFYSFKNKKVDNLNNTSIVNKLVYKDFEMLFMGDAEIEVEEELIKNKIEIQADILKVGHHGSNTSSSRKFLELVKPEIAVISVGKDNKFGHPSLRTLNRFNNLGIKVLRTDNLGTVFIKTDGYSFKIGL